MPQEKLKTMLMQNFGGQTRCIMGDVKVANKSITLGYRASSTRKLPGSFARLNHVYTWTLVPLRSVTVAGVKSVRIRNDLLRVLGKRMLMA